MLGAGGVVGHFTTREPTASKPIKQNTQQSFISRRPGGGPCSTSGVSITARIARSGRAFSCCCRCWATARGVGGARRRSTWTVRDRGEFGTPSEGSAAKHVEMRLIEAMWLYENNRPLKAAGAVPGNPARIRGYARSGGRGAEPHPGGDGAAAGSDRVKQQAEAACCWLGQARGEQEPVLPCPVRLFNSMAPSRRRAAHSAWGRPRPGAAGPTGIFRAAGTGRGG
jgi:hypothetical protein